MMATTKKLALGLATFALVLASTGIAGAQFAPEPQPQSTSLIGAWAAKGVIDGRPGVIGFIFAPNGKCAFLRLDEQGHLVKKIEGTFRIVEGRYVQMSFQNGENVTAAVAVIQVNRIAMKVNGKELVLDRVPLNN